MIELLTALFLLLGCFFMLAAAIGICRFPDLYMQMHASTKVGTVGIVSMVFAVAIFFQDLGVTIRALLIIAFFFLTIPIAAQVIGRAGYLSGVEIWDKTVRDDYAEYVAKLDRQEAADALKEDDPSV